MLFGVILLSIFSSVLAVAANTDQKCINCATPGLIDNWGMTGYTKQPDGLIFDKRCINDSVWMGANTVNTCETKTCVIMVIPIGTSSWEYVRGCHASFFESNNPNYTKTISGVTAPTGTTVGVKKCTYLTLENNRNNMLSFCESKEDGADLCNNDLKSTNGENPTIETYCTVVSPVECVLCASYDGKGKCSSGEKSRGNGALCAKTSGKLGGHDYVERAPTTILPTDKTEFCVPISSTESMVYGPTVGANVTRSKRAVNMVFTGQTCYCNQAGCNSAPTTMIGTSLSLVALLVVLPFFC